MSTKATPDATTAIVEAGVDLVQMELPDVNGALRGKFLAVEKVKPTSKSAVCTVVYQLTPDDGVWTSVHSSYDNGFPDVLGHPDMTTATKLPWRNNQAAVIYDVNRRDGEPFPLASRNVLRRVAGLFDETGLEPRFGVEFECFVLHADRELIAHGRYHDMAALGRMHNAYRLNQADEARELGVEFIRRMRSIGIGVEVFHTELGRGAVEFALSPETPLRAADNAVRAKTYFRELCAERGLVSTFMAKWHGDESGCGGHVHQSLWRGADNIFGEPSSGDISPQARHYLAGMLCTMSDCNVMFRPFVNSYRRLDHKAWSPENASWGYDNRSAALRVITYPSAEAVRVEHRVPGADANPYLSLAAMLAGGHYGIVNRLDLAPAALGNATERGAFERLPDSLCEATVAFRASSFCREYFGDEFVTHFAESRDVEWLHWCEWQKTNITRFELDRLFETA
ncbi:MAG: glutamine synthetase [Roseitalea sp.]|jgi:glutamine synthetase|uniref:Glutamine synthetase n=1 Tax=Oceaniradius stylonematis TaxID=2184161 RepID=A0A3A8AMM6_9HYPH|nr:glutamine synthetase family protein [Oceaniradius stylonematis]MBO6554303.1 glutamine synthetase [Roseitalea sp.]MBO6953347.1 glutamine synthetase [Rhizobiaceae bacterium]MBO6593694.1 glutamine synthetase [Roseitalea sp.]MBO6601090.1 glutamine synthetase [Roseitalea sp.]MBO6612771.1 glutamine synthetase [Roseitalea sp.]